MPVSLAVGDGELIATPLGRRASALSSLAAAHGFVLVPAPTGGCRREPDRSSRRTGSRPTRPPVSLPGVEVLRIRDGPLAVDGAPPRLGARRRRAGRVAEQVGCVYYEAPAATVLIDPLVPTDEAEAAGSTRRSTATWSAAAAGRDPPHHPLARALVLGDPRPVRHHRRLAGRRHEIWRSATRTARSSCGSPSTGALVAGDIILGSDTLGTMPARRADGWRRRPGTGTARAAGVVRAVDAGAIEPLAALGAEMVLVAHGTPVLENGAAALEAALQRAAG